MPGRELRAVLFHTQHDTTASSECGGVAIPATPNSPLPGDDPRGVGLGVGVVLRQLISVAFRPPETAKGRVSKRPYLFSLPAEDSYAQSSRVACRRQKFCRSK